MFLNRRDHGSHSLIPIPGMKGTCTIETVTLDAFLRGQKVDMRRIRFMKMDIEGFELLALRGASDVLRVCPMIMLEYSPQYMAQGNLRPRDLLELMSANGYHAHYLIRGALHPAKPESLLDERQIDLFWCKR